MNKTKESWKEEFEKKFKKWFSDNREPNDRYDYHSFIYNLCLKVEAEAEKRGYEKGYKDRAWEESKYPSLEIDQIRQQAIKETCEKMDSLVKKNKISWARINNNKGPVYIDLKDLLVQLKTLKLKF